jgi:hypothetical protein
VLQLKAKNRTGQGLDFFRMLKRPHYNRLSEPNRKFLFPAK